MQDKKLFVGALALLVFIPLIMAVFGGDKFRYPCQDPANWNESFCKPPICDVTRTCPEHIFKGQRDPRLGPPAPEPASAPVAPTPTQKQGVNCGK
jgi:hypothetical protein